jgi:hypothetical protein
MRALLTLAAGLIASLATVAPASADVPPSSPAPIVVGSGTFTVEFPNDTNTCGFPLNERIDVRSSFRFFESEDGPFVNIFHANIDYTFSANGKTVLVQQRYTDRFPILVAELTESGLTIQIRFAGGGLVIRDAGLFVMQFDGTVNLVRGPHPVLEAGGGSAAVAAICAALV